MWAGDQKPHPPILIGGARERKTLRLVAQYGNACNLSLRLGKDEVQRKLGVWQTHCFQTVTYSIEKEWTS